MPKGSGLPGMLTPRQTSRRSRLLYHWRADDYSVQPLTGQAPTFARATIGGAIRDVHGRLRVPVHSAPLWDAVDLDGDGAYEQATVLLSRAVTNVCLQSEDFGTTPWSVGGSPTRVAAAKTCGVLALDLVGDDDAAVAEAFTQDLAFTGDAVKALAVYWAPGTSSSSLLRLRDVTGAAERLVAQVAPGAGGVPSVTITVGTYLGYETVRDALGEVVYRLLFQTASVTAANTNRLLIYPATTTGLVAGNTGTVYIGGVQAENAEVPGPYVKATGVAATKAEDQLSWAIDFLPQALTMYARFRECGTAGLSNSARVFSLSNTTNPRVLLHGTGSRYRILHAEASGSAISSGGPLPAIGDDVELVGQLYGDGSVQFHQRINGGAVWSGTRSAALAIGAAWGAATAIANGPSVPGTINAIAFKVAAGVRTLDEMREAF
jgi:hypothetical protein